MNERGSREIGLENDCKSEPKRSTDGWYNSESSGPPVCDVVEKAVSGAETHTVTDAGADGTRGAFSVSKLNTGAAENEGWAS